MMRVRCSFVCFILFLCLLSPSVRADYDNSYIFVECLPELDTFILRTEDLDAERPDGYIQTKYLDIFSGFNRSMFPYHKACKFMGWHKGQSLYVDIRSDIKNDVIVYKVLLHYNRIPLLDTQWGEKLIFKFNGKGYMDLVITKDYQYTIYLDAPLFIPKRSGWSPYNIIRDQSQDRHIMEIGYDIKICCKENSSCKAVPNASFVLPISTKDILSQYCGIN